MSQRSSKIGSCAQCDRRDVDVSFDAASRKYLCRVCWPLPVRKASNSDWEERYDGRMPKESEILELRNDLYGIRVEDDRQHPGDFVVVCPEHGLVAGELTSYDARSLCAEHKDGHVPLAELPVLSPQQ